MMMERVYTPDAQWRDVWRPDIKPSDDVAELVRRVLSGGPPVPDKLDPDAAVEWVGRVLKVNAEDARRLLDVFAGWGNLNRAPVTT